MISSAGGGGQRNFLEEGDSAHWWLWQGTVGRLAVGVIAVTRSSKGPMAAVSELRATLCDGCERGMDMSWFGDGIESAVPRLQIELATLMPPRILPVTFMALPSYSRLFSQDAA